jgi:hypothetical protein
VGDVANVGEVEEVGVITDLDRVLAAAVGIQVPSAELDVALSEEASGADRARQELGGFFAVGLEDNLLGVRLSWSKWLVSYLCPFSLHMPA